MVSYGRNLAASPDALSSDRRLRVSDATRTDRGSGGGKIHLHVDGQGIPLGVPATGANVHDSRMIGATLKNSQEIGSWFLGADARHLCLDKGYDRPRVSEEV